MKINTLLATNILLLVVNLLTVVGNIFIPRFLDRPEVTVVSVDALIDEIEFQIPNSIASVVSVVLDIREDGDDFLLNKRCFDALDSQGLVPLTCRDALTDTLEIIKRNSESEKSVKLEALENIEDFDEAELTEALKLSRPLGYISNFYNDVFFNLLAAENIAKEEIAEPMREALVASAIKLVEREFLYLNSLDSALEILNRSDPSDDKQSNIVIRVVLLNSGYATDLISPTANISFGERVVNLKLIEPDSIKDQEFVQSEHAAIESGASATLQFYLDPKINTVDTNRFVQDLFDNSAPKEYDLEIESSVGFLQKSGSMESRNMSFEVDG